MKKLTKSQVIALVKKNGSIVVELYPSKCGPANQTWVQGMSVELFLDKGEVVSRDMQDRNMGTQTFNEVINAFMYYSCIPELGKRVHYYTND